MIRHRPGKTTWPADPIATAGRNIVVVLETLVLDNR
jgi:hypothetical protein